MCGIFGYFDRSGESLHSDVLTAMQQAIVHRGPDDSGIFAAPGIALGNNRLSIIDLAGGHQPFVSDDGAITVVQNGEIFNHIELAAELASTGFPCRTHSDTEVLLRLYERDGIDFVSKLNGMFAIGIYDRREDALYLIRDRVGVKPLHIYDDGYRLVFGSELKAILRAGVPRELAPEALHHFLTYNYVPLPLTMFQGIQHVMPGHWMKVDRAGTTNTVRWWDLAASRSQERDEQDWMTDLMTVLDDAVRLRLRCDVPFGAFLSGGVDSSTVVGLMARHLDQPADTFCIGFHDPRFDEAAFAQAAADRFGTNHVMERVEANMLDLWPLATYHCDQPHGDVSFLPTYRVSELASRHVKVICTGDGGDELFAGYDKYRDFFTPEALAVDEETFRRAYYQNISMFTDEAKSALYTPAFASQVEGLASYEVVRPLFEASAHMDRINQALYIDMMQLLPGNNLVKPDRMGMAVSIEARTPFLDYRMMELAFSMPGHLKLRDGETKYILKKAVTPLIGEELAYRKKQMFTVPVGEWFRRELSDYTRATLLSERATSRGLFDPVRVEEMLSAHEAGSANFTREIRALIALELWFQIFIDAPGEPPSNAMAHKRPMTDNAPV